MKPYRRTAIKYGKCAADALSQMNRFGIFDHKTFLLKNHLSPSFLKILTELKYVSKHKNGKNVIYSNLKSPLSIDLNDGFKIAQKSLEYNNKHKSLTKYNSDNKCKEITDNIVNTSNSELIRLDNISKFSDKELYDELCSRGYRGQMEKRAIITLK